MKKFKMINLVTNKETETICVHTHAAACEYFAATMPNMTSSWLLVEVLHHSM